MLSMGKDLSSIAEKVPSNRVGISTHVNFEGGKSEV